MLNDELLPAGKASLRGLPLVEIKARLHAGKHRALPNAMRGLLDSREEVRKACTDWIMKISPGYHVREALAQALKDEQAAMRAAAAKTLALFYYPSFGPRLVRLLDDPVLDVRRAAVMTLAERYPEIASPAFESPAFTEVIVNPNSDHETRASTAFVLQWYAGAQIADLLIAELHQVPLIRAHVRSVETNGTGCDAVFALIRLLENPVPEVIRNAVVALEQLDFRAVPGLLDMVRPLLCNSRVDSWMEHDYRKLSNGLRVLAYLRDPSTFAVIARALRHHDARMRRDGALCLGNFGDARAGEILQGALLDPSLHVRRAATQARVMLELWPLQRP